LIQPRLPRPPSPFPGINVTVIKAGIVLHRTHARDFRPEQFNPCLGQPTRFAPFDDAANRCVPTLYAATSREAAAFETIFHDIEASAAFKTVRLDIVQARSVSRIAPTRDLRLVSLFAPDLKAWRLRRADLIDTPKSVYDRTVLWASAIHDAHANVDGLIWTSRQCDPERCMVLFEDRISERSFDVLERLEVATNAALLLELRGFGRRAGIDIVS
jgi:hypothetical protein